MHCNNKTTEVMKKYNFVYLDHEGNELKREVKDFFNIKAARYHAKRIMAESMLCDLAKIKVNLAK